jgi:uncharacterized protein with PIN domain
MSSAAVTDATLAMPSPPKFIADAMLGSLARKLRIFGFDTAYFKEGDDAELEALARKERRVILTSDKSLFAHCHAKGLRAVLVLGRTDRARLLVVQAQAGVSMGSGIRAEMASRCAACNGELVLVGKRDAAAAKLPAKVIARHRLFYRCASCSRFYWRGRHWERLRRLSSSLKTKALT